MSARQMETPRAEGQGTEPPRPDTPCPDTPSADTQRLEPQRPESLRTRTLPLEGLARPLVCRWPAAGPVAGVVVFCHGLGSHGREYSQLSEHWAAHGYLVIHPTFDDSIYVAAPALGLDPDSDLSGWTALPEARAALHRMLHDPAYWLSRLAIVGTVMDRLPVILAACGLPVRDDPVAIAGHSYGAYTTQLLAGCVIDLPDAPNQSFRDPRFSAAVILSGQGRDQQGLREGSWDAMTLPALTVTGTLDRGANGGGVDWKSEPFTLAHAPEQYLLVLDNAAHMLGGFDATGQQLRVPAQAAAVRQVTLQFLDATLRQDDLARAALRRPTDHIGDCRVTFDYR